VPSPSLCRSTDVRIRHLLTIVVPPLRLPPRGPVVLSLDGGERVLALVKELLANHGFERTPWVAVATENQLHANWRDGSEFDG
jgi:hypothetical protein